MTLESELAQHRQRIATDAYPMSISEIANLYRDDELDIHPEFQRIFRWSDPQRTKLIESILLGIPLPNIFVAQSQDGIWDVVDGVQRLSTIFQFLGILRDEDNDKVEPLVCGQAPFLKSLEGVTYEAGFGGTSSLNNAQRLDFKRARVDVKIIKRESDARAKYDLFQRLNSMGSAATPQELRNCLLVGLSKPHYEWLKAISNSDAFLTAISIPERLIQEQYHLELALRFVSLRNLPAAEFSSIGNIGDFLSAQVLSLIELDAAGLDAERETFIACFELLLRALGSDAMRKWNPARERAEGPFSSTAFEALALGLGYSDAYRRTTPDKIIRAREILWSDGNFSPGHATGIRADTRMRKTLPFGRNLFVG